MMNERKDAALAAPGVVYALADWIGGWTPEQWVTALTLTYLVLCIVAWFWRAGASAIAWLRARKVDK